MPTTFFPGPRVFLANKAISQTGGHGDVRKAHDKNGGGGGGGGGDCCQCGAQSSSISVVADGVQACLAATREQLRQGADFIKIMVGGGVASPTDRIENTQFTAAEVRAVADVADSYGTYVTAQRVHAAGDSARSGQWRRRHRARQPARRGHGARYMAARNVWLTPTLITYQAMGEPQYSAFLPPANQAKNQQVLARGVAALRVAHDAGVTICHGSDLLGPLQAEQSREFGLRKTAAGLPERRGAQGRKRYTRRACSGRSTCWGRSGPGSRRDVLVLKGNPLRTWASWMSRRGACWWW